MSKGIQMKNILWGLSLALMLFTASSNAEIYKWKDKNGVVRYSDIPPPSNVPYQSIGKKTTKEPASATEPTSAAPTPDSAPVAAPQQKTPEEPSMVDADKQQKEEEAARQKAAAAEAEQKQKQELCANAKAKLQSLQQGGRIYKMNEKGEREFMDEAAVAQGVADAQAEVDKNCG
jgi:hypothetical protein